MTVPIPLSRCHEENQRKLRDGLAVEVAVKTKKLWEKNEALKHANATKDEFYQNISHDRY